MLVNFFKLYFFENIFNWNGVLLDRWYDFLKGRSWVNVFYNNNNNYNIFINIVYFSKSFFEKFMIVIFEVDKKLIIKLKKLEK